MIETTTCSLDETNPATKPDEQLRRFIKDAAIAGTKVFRNLDQMRSFWTWCPLE